MIRHLLTLMWNRKRANGLLIAEMVLAFFVLFAVGSLGIYLQRNYQSPLGFSYENVWEMQLDPGSQPRAEQFATLQLALQRLRSTPGVEAVTRSNYNTPFTFNNNTTDFDTGKGTKKAPGDIYRVGAELPQVVGLHLLAGRWFDRRDDAPGARPPIVITDLTQTALFGGQSGLGKIVRDGPNEYRVIGVSGPYRAGGELSDPQPAAFRYVAPLDTSTVDLHVLLLRVRPGAGAALEKQLNEQVRQLNAGWTSGITPMAESRHNKLKQLLTLPALLGVVCLFLIVNVMLGLFGVLWLNINQRRGELGLRRAMGATSGAISRQIVGEILTLTTFGLLLGLGLAVQFPLLGVFDVPAGVYGTAIVLATALLYTLAAGCALYPSQLAAGIHPAVALREE